MRARTVTSFLVALIVVVFVAQGAVAQAPVSQFDAILAQQVVATNSMDVPVLRVSTSATIAGSLVSASSNLGASSVTTLSSTGTVAAQRLATAISAQQTVTTSTLITNVAGIVVVTAAGAVTAGSIYTGTNGQLLTIVNGGTNAVTVPDSGLNRLSAAITLGQYDTLTVAWYNGGWTQIATSNN